MSYNYWNLLLLIALVFTSPALALGVLGTLAAISNFRRCLRSRRLAPLEHLSDDVHRGVPPGRRPARWPNPSNQQDPQMRTAGRCRAYARLAEEKGNNYQLLGEMLTLFAGGFAGVVVGAISATDSQVLIQPAIGLVVMGAVGTWWRVQVAPGWRRLALRYQQAAALNADLSTSGHIGAIALREHDIQPQGN